MPQSLSDRFRVGAEVLLAAFAAFVSWNAVRWALEPGLFLIMDEMGMITRFIDFSYWENVSLLPTWIYNDRPIGFLLEGVLFDIFGFNYPHHLSVVLVFHFANCVMGFLLARRLAVSVPLSLAAAGLYGGLWTTTQTSTYLGETFDVTCLFFLLGSILTFLSKWRGSTIVSAFLFLVAVRSKEFAIFAPILLVILTLRTLGVRALFLRVWPHFLIAAVIGIRYLSFLPKARETILPNDPYHADLKVSAVLSGLSYYSALILGAATPAAVNVLFFACAWVALAAYGLWRRNDGLLFCLAAYVLLLLPVSMLPGARHVFYLYAPQMFFILAGAILIEDLSARLFKQPVWRWAAAFGMSAALLAWTFTLQLGPVFQNGKAFTLSLRRASATTAQSAQAFLPSIQPKMQIYVNNGGQTPWLLVPGPCDYFRLATRVTSITCSMNQSKEALEAAYQRDKGPKLLLDYREGSLTVRQE